MIYKKFPKLLFLSWGSPWPAHSGGDLRTSGLLKELSKAFEIELIVLARSPLSKDQLNVLSNYSHNVVQIPLRSASLQDKLRIVVLMSKFRITYHCAVIEASFQSHLDILEKVRSFSGVVYAARGHWGTLIRDRQARNWILDQYDADVDFWRVYASQASNLPMKLAALMNWRLANSCFRRIYPRVGHIISVCEEDKRLTQSLALDAKIDVVQNGVDCSYYSPAKITRTGSPRLLFTGTSAARNMTALRKFVHDVFPLIQRELSGVELLVGGNFRTKSQVEFNKHHNIRFTGFVEDIRPVFNQCDVFVAPFEETHGSKLKVAEAMAMGMPIVSTPEGVRGFSLVDGESVLIARSDGQFVAHAITLLTNSKLREKLGTAARKVAVSSIDWQILGKRLIEIVNSASC